VRRRPAVAFYSPLTSFTARCAACFSTYRYATVNTHAHAYVGTLSSLLAMLLHCIPSHALLPLPASSLAANPEMRLRDLGNPLLY
jgi:hypothetical protein